MSYRSYKDYWWDIGECVVSHAVNLFFLQRKREPRPQQCCVLAAPRQSPPCFGCSNRLCVKLRRAKKWFNSRRNGTEKFISHIQTCCSHWHPRAVSRTSGLGTAWATCSWLCDLSVYIGLSLDITKGLANVFEKPIISLKGENSLI